MEIIGALIISFLIFISVVFYKIKENIYQSIAESISNNIVRILKTLSLYYLKNKLPLKFYYWLNERNLFTINDDVKNRINFLKNIKDELKNKFVIGDYNDVYQELDAVENHNKYADKSSSKKVLPTIIREIRKLTNEKKYEDCNDLLTTTLTNESTLVTNLTNVLMENEKPYILLGEPGSGKSFTLRDVAIKIIDKELKKIDPKIIIFIEISSIEQGDTINENIIEDIIKDHIKYNNYSYEDLKKNNKLVVFFDGLDELRSDKSSKYFDEFSKFATSNTEIKLIFSCRINEFDPSFNHQQLILQPFDRAMQIKYLSEYYDSHLTDVIIDDKQYTKKEFVDKISKGNLHEFIHIPINIYLLCEYIYYKNTFPTNRIQIYEVYFQKSFETYEDKYNKDKNNIDYKRLLKLYTNIAYIINTKNIGSQITLTTDLLNCSENDLEILFNVGNKCRIFDTYEDKPMYTISFKHQRFQEYLTAKYIYDMDVSIDWNKYINNVSWQESILFYLAIYFNDTNIVSKNNSTLLIDIFNQVLDDALNIKKIQEKYGLDSKEKDVKKDIVGYTYKEDFLVNLILLISKVIKDYNNSKKSFITEDKINKYFNNLSEKANDTIKKLYEHCHIINKKNLLYSSRNFNQDLMYNLIENNKIKSSWFEKHIKFLYLESSNYLNDFQKIILSDVAKNVFLDKYKEYKLLTNKVTNNQINEKQFLVPIIYSALLYIIPIILFIIGFDLYINRFDFNRDWWIFIFTILIYSLSTIP